VYNLAEAIASRSYIKKNFWLL